MIDNEAIFVFCLVGVLFALYGVLLVWHGKKGLL